MQYGNIINMIIIENKKEKDIIKLQRWRRPTTKEKKESRKKEILAQ